MRNTGSSRTRKREPEIVVRLTRAEADKAALICGWWGADGKNFPIFASASRKLRAALGEETL